MKGAEIPPPFGGKYRQIMVYVDPYKLLFARNSARWTWSTRSTTRTHPAGGRRQDRARTITTCIPTASSIHEADSTKFPSKTMKDSMGAVSDVGKAEDARPFSTTSCASADRNPLTIPIMKAGGDTQHDSGCQLRPQSDQPSLRCADTAKDDYLFDQSVFVKEAINTVVHEGLDRIGPDQHHDPAVPRQMCAPRVPSCCRFRSPRWQRW